MPDTYVTDEPDTSRVRRVVDNALADIQDCHERQADLTLFYLGGVTTRRQACEMILRMLSRPDLLEPERAAIRELRRRYGIGAATIAGGLARASGSRAGECGGYPGSRARR